MIDKKTDPKKAETYQQFHNITSALLGPIAMFGLIGYGISHYTDFSFGSEIGIILGSIIGIILVIREASKL